jgi:hypothetical protein
MDEVTLPIIFFQFLPETLILTTLSLALTGYEIKLKKVLVVAVIASMISVLIRSLPFPYGVNVILQLPMLVILLMIFFKLNIISSLIASCSGFVVIGLIEGVFNFIVSTATGISLKQAMVDPVLRVLFPIPEYVFLIILIIICKRYHFVLFNIREMNDLGRMKDYE